MIFVASATARWAMQLGVQCVLPPNGPPLPFWVFGAILPVFAPQMPAPRPILAGRGSWGLRGARRRPPHPTHVARLGCEAVVTHERVFGGCTGYSMSYLGRERFALSKVIKSFPLFGQIWPDGVTSHHGWSDDHPHDTLGCSADSIGTAHQHLHKT